MFGGYQGYRDAQTKLEQRRKETSGKLSYRDSSDKIIQVKRTNPDTGITVSHDMRLALLKPTHSYMPTKNDVTIVEYQYSVGFVSNLLKKFSGVIAVDIETRGTQAADPECIIVGIGIADGSNIIYLDFATNGSEVNDSVLEWLAQYDKGIVGHNIFFDGAFLQRYCGKWIGWKFDTYALYRQLANEGHPGHRYGLKNAQLDLLNWDAKGDVDLDKWLVSNGYIGDIKKEKKTGYVHVDDYEGKGERWVKPRKEEMFRAPASILGFYCGLDCAATWQLLHEVFLPCINNEPFTETFLNYHEIFVKNVEVMASQQLSGITIDREMLQTYHMELEENISRHYEEFINHPEVRPAATAYNQLAIAELMDKEPTKYKKQKIPKEPIKLKKDGSVSKSWENWETKTALLKEQGPDITAHWTGWNEKVEVAKQKEHLNLNSGAQLQWLFYEQLGHERLIITASGQASTGAQALPFFGAVGQLLKQQKDTVKEESYVSTCLEHITDDGRIHPQFRMPGTLTCRLAGSGGLNLQQIPKSKGYLDCWKPLPGRAWIDCDHTALEQVVLAELSGDNSLRKIYGPGAKPNDVYIFNGAIMARDYGVKLFQPFLDAGYDPENPKADIIAKIKKEYKGLRGISKTASLGKSYGMGWKKFQMNMKAHKVNMTEDECRAVITGLDGVYAGVKEYEKFLLSEYRKNNGWVLNGIGRPVGCAEDYIKDIVNRVIQSTGHDIHMAYIDICDRLLKQAGIQVEGIVWDFHDQSILECDAKDAENVHYIIGTKAYEILNDKYLRGEIKLKGDPQHIKTMADAKCE